MALYSYKVPENLIPAFMQKIQAVDLQAQEHDKRYIMRTVYVQCNIAWNHYLTGYLDGLQDAHKKKDVQG